MRKLTLLGLDDARELADHLLAVANQDGLGPVAICVVDGSGVQLMAQTMDGVKTSSIRFAHNKAVTAVTFGQDTVEFSGWTVQDVINGANHTGGTFSSWGGGVLVVSLHDGSILGAIGVSGRTEAQDHELASSRPAGWTA